MGSVFVHRSDLRFFSICGSVLKTKMAAGNNGQSIPDLYRHDQLRNLPAGEDSERCRAVFAPCQTPCSCAAPHRGGYVRTCDTFVEPPGKAVSALETFL